MNKQQLINKETDELTELFVWSDDKLAIEDKVNELLDFDDNLRDALYNIIAKSVGSNGKSLATASNLLHMQLEKTVKEFVEYKVESES